MHSPENWNDLGGSFAAGGNLHGNAGGRRRRCGARPPVRALLAAPTARELGVVGPPAWEPGAVPALEREPGPVKEPGVLQPARLAAPSISDWVPHRRVDPAHHV
jgi:hypothetical protein